MKRQIGPVTCVHSYGQLDAQKGEKKKTFENLQDFAYIDQDEWKSNNLEKGGVKDQMKRLKKAKIVKLV